MKTKFNAVIFDMDGLIVDTEELYYRTYNQTLNDHDVNIPREGYTRCVGHPVEDNSRDAVEIYHLKTSPEAFLTTWMDRFEQAISDPNQIALMPGFLKFLNHLRQTDCLLGIASSTQRPRMQKTLQNGLLPRLGASLGEVFGALLSGSDVTHTKPDPEIYLLAAERLDVSPESCCVFEDSQAGVQSGKAAGMTVFAVPNFFTAHQDHTDADHILSNLTEAIEKV